MMRFVESKLNNKRFVENAPDSGSTRITNLGLTLTRNLKIISNSKSLEI